MASETRLFVGNLPAGASEEELSREFSAYGSVTKVELKTKSDETESKFAFITLASTHYNVESCIKHFSIEDYNGSKLYVTRARESFMERLQRERAQASEKEQAKHKGESPTVENLNLSKPSIINLGEKLTPGKRKVDKQQASILNHQEPKPKKKFATASFPISNPDLPVSKNDRLGNVDSFEGDKRKKDADQKRLDSIKQKRQEFKQKQMVIKTGLIGVDTPNKKIVFTDHDDEHVDINSPTKHLAKLPAKRTKELFDGEDSDNELNFEIKEQFEGEKGRKILDLQSRYQADKRFVLDERFIDDNIPDVDETEAKLDNDNEQIDGSQIDEKSKQLTILQDVLGVAIKTRKEPFNENKKTKPKLGMLRFDPSQPDHAKFLAPVENVKKESTKKQKKTKKGEVQVEELPEETVEPTKVEVSKEQFYKVSDTLKEAIAQPTSFSLRSMFGRDEDNEKDEHIKPQEEMNYIPLAKQKTKSKNPLDPSAKNPIVYDSSDSDDEIEGEKTQPDEKVPEKSDVAATTKAVWKEKLFFTQDDHRLREALIFFNNASEGHKERRELRALMKKRIYNNERKNQMFKKKLGGKRKTVKKFYKKKS